MIDPTVRSGRPWRRRVVDAVFFLRSRPWWRRWAGGWWVVGLPDKPGVPQTDGLARFLGAGLLRWCAADDCCCQGGPVVLDFGHRGALLIPPPTRCTCELNP